jgi:hypothetical protein
MKKKFLIAPFNSPEGGKYAAQSPSLLGRVGVGLQFLIIFLAVVMMPFRVYAQQSQAKRAVEKNMEKKYAPQRQKGKEEIGKITYENDKRYKDPNNKVQASFSFETKSFKKGKVKDTESDKMVFGKTGECMVLNAGSKGESWMIFNYADKANYMVTPRNKSAMKMPLINMQKMIEKQAKKEAERMEAGGSWQVSDERQNINGFNCRKVIYTYPPKSKYSVMEAWVTDDARPNMSGNYMFGARLNSYKLPSGAAYGNGFMVRMVMYNKKGKPVSERDLVSFENTADNHYFDLSGYKVNDVLSAL